MLAHRRHFIGRDKMIKLWDLTAQTKESSCIGSIRCAFTAQAIQKYNDKLIAGTVMFDRESGYSDGNSNRK